jgi:hypothetical protein
MRERGEEEEMHLENRHINKKSSIVKSTVRVSEREDMTKTH